MADLIIRGMEMPKNEPLTITITPEGKVFRAFIPESYGEVILLPEGHGRLGDLDALQEEFKKYHDGKRLMLIDTAALTIVPAEGGDEDG